MEGEEEMGIVPRSVGGRRAWTRRLLSCILQFYRIGGTCAHGTSDPCTSDPCTSDLRAGPRTASRALAPLDLSLTPHSPSSHGRV